MFRPKQLENVNVFDFLMQHDVNRLKFKGKRVRKRKEDRDLVQFEKEHPECEEHTVRRHFRNKIPKFSTLLWPDTKRFEGSIFEDTPRSKRALNAMDEYAKYTLIMFYPFRELNDIVLDNSFRKKLISEGIYAKMRNKNMQISKKYAKYAKQHAFALSRRPTRF